MYGMRITQLLHWQCLPANTERTTIAHITHPTIGLLNFYEVPHMHGIIEVSSVRQ